MESKTIVKMTKRTEASEMVKAIKGFKRNQGESCS